MEHLSNEAALRTFGGAVAIAIAVGVQFVPVFQKRLDRLTARYPALKLLSYRLFQLAAGFALLTIGIELLQLR